jgi:hypothetical protein
MPRKATTVGPWISMLLGTFDQTARTDGDGASAQIEKATTGILSQAAGMQERLCFRQFGTRCTRRVSHGAGEHTVARAGAAASG